MTRWNFEYHDEKRISNHPKGWKIKNGNGEKERKKKKNIFDNNATVSVSLCKKIFSFFFLKLRGIRV